MIDIKSSESEAGKCKALANDNFLKLHHQFAVLIDMYLHAKINFIPPIVFEILKFKNPAIRMAESIFAFNSRTRFFPDIRF